MDAPSVQPAGLFADGGGFRGILGAFESFEGVVFLLIVALAGVCVVWGLLLARTCRGRGRVQRVAATLMPLAVFLVALLYVRRTVLVLHRSEEWNGALLAPAIALARGHPLYSGPDAGPIQVTEYGPVSAIAYLPAAVASTPTPAMLIAGAITVLLILSPLVLLFARGRWKAPGQRVPALAGFVFAASALSLVDASDEFITKIGPDAPAVALGLLSCLVIMGTDKAPGRRRLAVCALLVTLSCWAKQIEAPLILAQALYLGVAYRWRTAARYLAWVLVTGTAIGLGFVAVFGFEHMVWHMFIKQARQGWDPTLFKYGFVLLRQSIVFIVLVAVASAVAWEFARRSRQGLRSWLRANPWPLLVVAAVLLLPTGALADAKPDGDENNYHSAYYLIAASALILVHFATKGPSRTVRKHAGRLLVLLAAWALVCQPTAFLPPPELFALEANPQQEAYRFARSHPGEVYAPWYPLASLMAEGRLYHAAPGVRDRIQGGYTPTDTHFRAHLPPNMRYLIFHKDRQDQCIRDFLPQFRRRIPVGPERVSDWVGYASPHVSPELRTVAPGSG